MKKYTLILICAGLVLSANECKKNKQEAMKALFDKTWIASNEENVKGVMVYRPEGYKFPLSRGPRQRFKFSADGTFVQTIAPADAPIDLKGTWKTAENNTIKTELEKNDFIPNTSNTYKIIECNADVLKIQQL